MNAFTLLADSVAANNFGDTRSGGLAGPMGLFVILVLVIGTVLLIRNMNSRLRRLPNNFSSTDTAGSAPEEEPGAQPTAPKESTKR
ncbi:hypothetical protein ACNTMW_09535 [Planosporangium sp. 12N6]|uniref:hypothetical protein n=1 Tax=Planosporangium spinosum TaxID=3402278 RepID=UPI003CE74AE9